MYIKESLGWPAKGNWDLYPSQRLGPLPMEKGRRYLVEIWHGGQPGLKRCELAWSLTEGSPVENWVPAASFHQRRLSREGRFEPLRSEVAVPSDSPAFSEPASPLFPGGLAQWFQAPGDGFLYDLHEP